MKLKFKLIIFSIINLFILILPILFILVAWLLVIIIIAIIIAVFSNIWIPFYYNITNTIYDIPISNVNKTIDIKNINKNNSYFNILYTYLKQEDNSWIKDVNKNIWNESLNYVSNIKFYEELWKNTFLKNLELPLYLLKNIKVKVKDWIVIPIWNKNDIQFYYNLETWKFSDNSPFFMKFWQKLTNYYNKFKQYKCFDNTYKNITNIEKKDLYCYNKLPKIKLYTKINLDKKLKYWTLYNNYNIAIQWFWIKIINSKDKEWNKVKQLVFYFKIYKNFDYNYMINLKEYLWKIYLKRKQIKNYNDFVNKFYNIYKNAYSKYYLYSSNNFNLNSPYIIKGWDNMLFVNFQIQLLSLSSYLWNVKLNNWNKKLIYDVNIDKSWTWKIFLPKQVENYNNNDYNNSNLVLKDYYHYLSLDNLPDKYWWNIQLLFDKLYQKQNKDIKKQINEEVKVLNYNKIDKEAYYYYLYYVRWAYWDYLKQNNINLYSIKNKGFYYLWDNIKWYVGQFTKKKLLQSICSTIYYKQSQNSAYIQTFWIKENYEFIKKWKLWNKDLLNLYNILKKYCKNANNLKQIDQDNFIYKPISNDNIISKDLLQWYIFWPNEIKYLINYWFEINNKTTINSKLVDKFWYNLKKTSLLLKFVEYTKDNNFKYMSNDLNNEIQKIYENINNLPSKYWDKSSYIDYWFQLSFLQKFYNFILENYKTKQLKDYLNNYFWYVWYYQIKNDLRKLTEWKRNALEYLMYYKNTKNTNFKILDFTILNKFLFWWNNNIQDIPKISIQDYSFIDYNIIKDFYNKQWFTYQNNQNNQNTWNYVLFDKKNIIKYNYCDYMRNKFNTNEDFQKCKEFSKDAFTFLSLYNTNNTLKINNFAYLFYNKWFKKYKLFEGFWNKKGLFPYWEQATLNKKISNWRYPWQCVHYVVININKKDLYGWNAVNWCKIAKWKKWFEVINNLEEAKQKIWPWDIIVFDHLINWKSNWIWHIAMVSNVERNNNWKLSKVNIQEFNAWCWNSVLRTKYIIDNFLQNWINPNKYYLKWCVFYYNIKNININTLTRGQWWNNIMPLKCIIKIKNYKDYNNLQEILNKK